MDLTRRIQRAVIRTSPYRPLRWFYGAAYAALLLWLTMRLRRIAAVSYLELRAPRKDHHFGSSDLDVRAVTKPLSGREFFALADRLADVLRPTRRWMKILDFYVFGPDEAQLQRRLGPISFGNSRWIRLFGRDSAEASIPVPQPRWRNAEICRAMYEYGYISQALFQDAFEDSLDFHSTRNLYRRVARICGDSESATRSGASRALQPADLENVFIATFKQVGALFASSSAKGDVDGSSTFHLVRADDEPPDCMRGTIASCSAAVIEMCERLTGQVRGAMLGCVPGARFDYRIYLIIRDHLNRAELAEVFRIIRAIYTGPDTYNRIPSTYLRLRHPIVMTTSMWGARAGWYNALRPVEEYFFLLRHGAVLWGADLRQDLVAPSTADVTRSGAIAVADLRSGIWAAVHDRRPRQLIDALLGRVPILWLLFAHSLIASTSSEALRECASAGLPQASTLLDLHCRLSGLKPHELPATTDPIWKSAIDVALQMTDEIPRMAVARLDSQSEEMPLATRYADGFARSGPTGSAAERI